MLSFVLQKIRNKKWMMLSLFLGNLLLVAIAAANPMYSQAALQRTFSQNLSQHFAQTNKHPGIVTAESHGAAYGKVDYELVDKMQVKFDEMLEVLGVPELTSPTAYRLSGVRVTLPIKEDGGKETTQVELATYTDFKDYVTITHGELYGTNPEEGVLDVIVDKRTFVIKNMVLGEVMEMTNLADSTGAPYKVRITGIYERKDKEDPYWLTCAENTTGVFVIDEASFAKIIEKPGRETVLFDARFSAVLDYTQMRADRVEPMVQTLKQYKSELSNLDARNVRNSFQELLEDFMPEAKKVDTTILVLQIPVFVLLAAFIFMVSRQMLDIDQNEISVFKSRGASKGQIVSIYLQQSLLLALLSLLGGLPLGYLICKVLGASNAFLEFVQRTALPVELGRKVWIFAGVAALFSVCTMVLPAFRFASVTIVDHKRQKNRRNNNPMWQKLFLDVILLLISLYGLYQFRGKEDFLVEQVLKGAPLDPTLYLCSSLFMLGSGLFLLRLLPLLVQLIFQIGKKWWSPALYTSFLRLLRTKNNQGFLVVFLVMTVALGIFSTQTARTINANSEERIRYEIGADMVVQEPWSSSNSEAIAAGVASAVQEPDFDKYLKMDGVVNATKVLVDKQVTMSKDGQHVKDITLMGIHTKEFGETAWFKTKLLPVHWYEYLNVISQDTRAVLLSSNFQKAMTVQIGDAITYRDGAGNSMRGIVYGFVDYWPSYVANELVENVDGTYSMKENFLIVGHLSQIQATAGINPYQVWLDIDGSSKFMYDYAEENNIGFTLFKDTSAELVKLKNDPILQGTNGVLTIGFIIVLLLCATGFLIFWILSIQSRTLQFGIFRAMGMTGREILTMLINEQIFISGISIGGGVVVGQIAGKLFVPLIQIAYSSAERVIPLEVISETSDYMRLGIVIGLMIIVCMAILCALISKIKITQALKLGED